MWALIILTVIAASQGSSGRPVVESMGWRPLLERFETREECEALAKRIQPVRFECVKQKQS